MQDIGFIGYFDGEEVRVKIQLYWNDTYYLFLNNFLHGQLLLREGKWKFVPSKEADTLYTDDIYILSEMITNSGIG